MHPRPDGSLGSPKIEDVVARLRTAGCVFAEDEARLLLSKVASGTASQATVDVLIERRVAGEPLEHLLGWVEFCGLRLAIQAGVFVPRARTAVLVEQALDAVRAAAAGVPIVVDLCCGSGAVGAALRAAEPGVRLHAADLDAVAVRCARHNLPDATVHQGDLYDALPGNLRGRVDVLVANAPYVPTDAIAFMPPEARDHEPRAALDGGADGLGLLHRVIVGAPMWLAPGGTLLVEASSEQVTRLDGAVRSIGLEPAVVRDEDRGGTVVIAR